ncbi:hypothetical protein LTR08_009012 [Meristemomyces frigidus]|nr:hypothetical protein LTR08_009012 [Meristemomyces frigidus]
MASSCEVPPSYTVIRKPGQYEHRCITRHDLGYYGCVVIAGIYRAPARVPWPLSADAFFPALRQCIDRHPILSTAIKSADSKTPQFVRPSQLDLRRHIRVKGVVNTTAPEEANLVKEAIVECHDRIFRHSDLAPPWDVTVVPLGSDQDRGAMRLLVLLSYSHSHGDGTSGLGFHGTFLRALQNTPFTSKTDQSAIYETSDRPLLPAFDQVAHLKVSWSCLLGVGLYDSLPIFLRTSLGLQPMSPVTPNSWVANPVSYDVTAHLTGLEILLMENVTVTKLLTACRAHNARMTGLLHHLIVRSLRRAVAKHSVEPTFRNQACDIVAATPLNLRHLVPGWAGPAEMAMAVTEMMELFPAISPKNATASSAMDTPGGLINDSLWSGAKETGAKLAAAASTLQDQPTALLRYIPDFRSWMVGQVGKRRDCSYELSNIMAFDPDAHASTMPSSDGAMTTTPVERGGEGGWEVGNMYFSQPASVTGSPMNFQCRVEERR